MGVEQHIDHVGFEKRSVRKCATSTELKEPLWTAVENTAQGLNENIAHGCGAWVVGGLPEIPHTRAGDLELCAEMYEQSGSCDVSRKHRVRVGAVW